MDEKSREAKLLECLEIARKVGNKLLEQNLQLELVRLRKEQSR